MFAFFFPFVWSGTRDWHWLLGHLPTIVTFNSTSLTAGPS
jgi:hypothetical protein